MVCTNEYRTGIRNYYKNQLPVAWVLGFNVKVLGFSFRV